MFQLPEQYQQQLINYYIGNGYIFIQNNEINNNLDNDIEIKKNDEYYNFEDLCRRKR
ncbi:hypothetical protein MNB_SUP05-5-616 [hydrothermal vent metagenome]|uniref:Uncharacterized protein n=1 Tax=hydrothermal vent metagenome TaxID=652676 RepID=A0A1W1BF23_9ZZZZ